MGRGDGDSNEAIDANIRRQATLQEWDLDENQRQIILHISAYQQQKQPVTSKTIADFADIEAREAQEYMYPLIKSGLIKRRIITADSYYNAHYHLSEAGQDVAAAIENKSQISELRRLREQILDAPPDYLSWQRNQKDVDLLQQIYQQASSKQPITPDLISSFEGIDEIEVHHRVEPLLDAELLRRQMLNGVSHYQLTNIAEEIVTGQRPPTQPNDLLLYQQTQQCDQCRGHGHAWHPGSTGEAISDGPCATCEGQGEITHSDKVKVIGPDSAADEIRDSELTADQWLLMSLRDGREYVASEQQLHSLVTSD